MLDGFEKFARAAASEQWREEILETVVAARSKLG